MFAHFLLRLWHGGMGVVWQAWKKRFPITCMTLIQNQSQAERVSMTSTVTGEGGKKGRNHGTQDSRVVPHRGTNWAALWLTTQIERDAVLSKSYGRG